ncbi:MAG: hypothetical protein AAB800_00420 [Patescibacteria group bacterium]
MNTIPLETNNPQILALLEQLIHRYKIDTLPQEEQTLFYLEFARVIRLRCEKAKADNTTNISEDELLLREIQLVANNMLSVQI